MNLSPREIRVLLLHEFRLGRRATQETNNICNVMGEDAFSIRTVQQWFSCFTDGNLELDDFLAPVDH